MSIAANAWEQLESAGCRIHFIADPTTHRMAAALEDLEGHPLVVLAPSDVLAIAAGHQLLDRQYAAEEQTPRKLV
jgi:hypothetical protein